MLNDETRRKLRILNVGEFIEELEIQQQDPQTLALRECPKDCVNLHTDVR